MNFKIPFLLLVVFCFFIKLECVAQSSYKKVSIDIERHSMPELQKLGLPLDHIHLDKRNHKIECILSVEELDLLQNNQISYDVIIEDMKVHFLEKSKRSATASRKKTRALSCKSPKTYTVNGFSNGSHAGFFTENELYAQMDSLHARYPLIVSARQAIDTFKTHENRSIFWLKISDNPTVDENETEILFDAMHHAREPMAMHQLVYFMYYLCENYASDPEVKYFVDHAEMYFVPLVNPDGYVYNVSTNPSGGGLWRKNRRHNGGTSYGVDLNRNYPENWGANNVGSSPNPNSAVYRGIAPASEPETQAMIWFANQHNFKMNLSNHTYGDLLIYPYGPNQTAPLDSPIYIQHAHNMSEKNRYVFGTDLQTVQYETNGGSIDWQYANGINSTKTFAYTPEYGSSVQGGFWPSQFQFQDILDQAITLNINAMRSLLKYGKADDKSEKYFTTNTNHVQYVFNNYGFGAGPMIIKVIPITNNISSSASNTHMVANPLERYVDSIPVTISSSAQHGDLIQYVLEVDNGQLQYHDTISKYVASQINTLFFSDGSSFANWANSSGWNITNNVALNSPVITDGLNGQSQNMQNINLISPAFSLKGAIDANLSYDLRFVTECKEDFILVMGRRYYGASIPLCGKYSVESENPSAIGAAVYNGGQWNWAHEQMDLKDYLNDTVVQVVWQFSSDQFLTRDGYFMDNVKITSIGSAPTGIEDWEKYSIKVYPNPANNFLRIETNNAEKIEYKINGITGRTLSTGTLVNNQIPLDEISNGHYILKLLSNQDEKNIQFQVVR
jgi:hypothetical protein